MNVSTKVWTLSILTDTPQTHISFPCNNIFPNINVTVTENYRIFATD